MRRILSDILPADVLQRPKLNFVPPVWDWLNGVVKRYGAHLHQGNLVSQGIIRENSVDRLRNFEEENSHAHTVYRLVMLEIWYARMKQLIQPFPA